MRTNFLFFSIADDWPISLIFYILITGNAFLYAIYLAPILTGGSGGGGGFETPGEAARRKTIEENEYYINSSEHNAFVVLLLQVSRFLGSRYFIYYYFPMGLAAVANTFLTMTIFGDPGIVVGERLKALHEERSYMAAIGKLESSSGGGAGLHGKIQADIQEFLRAETARGGLAPGMKAVQEQIRGQEGARGGEENGAKAGGDGAEVNPDKDSSRDIFVDFNEGIDARLECHNCKVCKIPVEGFDHHCDVIGACIGRYTLGTFIVFTTSATIYCLFGLVVGTKIIFRNIFYPTKRSSTFEKEIPFIITICGLFGFLVCFYLAFHYIAFSFQGKTSLYRRKKWRKEHWSELSAEEKEGEHPLSGYLRPGKISNLLQVLANIRFWRFAPPVERENFQVPETREQKKAK